jgi:hypothetical protein
MSQSFDYFVGALQVQVSHHRVRGPRLNGSLVSHQALGSGRAIDVGK